MRNLPWPKSLASAALFLVSASAVAGTRTMGRVGPRDIAVHSLQADSGNRTVQLAGNGATDLDCYIYDPAGTFLGFDNGPNDRCLVTFRLRRSGTLHIEVENLGDARNDYWLELR